MSGDEASRITHKDERNRRLEEQLRDNLRKRKELARARKAAASRSDAPSATTQEHGSEEK